MCRLWGVQYGPEGAEAEQWTPSEMAQIMMPALVERGPHAFGWATWDGQDIDVQKFPGRPDTAEAIAKMNLEPNPKWIIGHTRWATHGDPAVNINNHPVRHHNILGAHNGVLTNHESILRVTGRYDNSSELDSEAIFAAIHKWGHRKGLSKIAGSMAVSYIDMEKPHIMNLARSQGRPLVYARTEAGSLIWSSEEQAIKKLAIKTGKIHTVPAFTFLRLKDGKVWQRAQLRSSPTMAPMQSARGYSASSTRRAMLSAQAQDEVERAEAFIARERAKSSARASARSSLNSPAAKVAERKGEPEYGTQREGRYYIGQDRWVSEAEYINDILDELGWD